MKTIYSLIGILFLSTVFLGCDPERNLISNNHDGRVPDVINFRAVIDSSKVTPSKYILKLYWGYDSIRYPSNPNIKHWEVYRVIANDTMTFKFQLQKFVQIPYFADSSVSVQPGTKEFISVLYRIIPVGNVIDNIQFTGKPSDIVRVIVPKK